MTYVSYASDRVTNGTTLQNASSYSDIGDVVSLR